MITDFKQNLKETFTLAIPVSIGQLGHIMMGVVDSLMVGRVGADSLAAASIANGVFFLLIVVGIGLNAAITSLVAIKSGEKNVSDCGNVLANAALINLAGSAILFILTYIISYYFEEMGQTPEVSRLAGSYLRIESFSILPFMFFQAYKQFCEGVSDVKPPMVFAILANLVNIFFNWVWIYGKFGFEPMGLNGAGYSTLMNRVFMWIGLGWYIYTNSSYKKYNMVLWPQKFDFKLIKRIIRIGLPSGMQYLFEVAAFTLSGLMVGWLGSKMLAAHHIALNLASVSYMVILGIATAGNIRVGNAWGEQNKTKIHNAGFTAIFLGVSIMFCSAVLMLIFRDFIPWIYIDDKAVIETTSSLLIIAGFFQVFDGLQAVSSGVLRGLLDVKIPMLIILGSYWVVGVPSGYYFAFYMNMGAFGIWLGFLIALIIIGGSLLARFIHIKKTIIK